MSIKKVILLAAGGTGGHFFPAVALAEELGLDLSLEVHIATDNRCKKYLIGNKLNYHIVDLYIDLKGIVNKLKLPFIMSIALFKAFILIKRLKPRIIIGFGGYPSFPVMFVGQLLSIPTIIYEQNSFFHDSKLDFIEGQKRDRRKIEWCELNNIIHIELPYEILLSVSSLS